MLFISVRKVEIWSAEEEEQTMKRLTIQLFGSVIVLLPIVMGAVLYQKSADQRELSGSITQQSTTEQIVQPESFLPTPTLVPPPIVITPRPTATPWPTPDLTPIAWSAPPPCTNQPLTVADWKYALQSEKSLDPEQIKTLLQRAQPLSAALRSFGNMQKLAALFEQTEAPEANRSLESAAALWLNVMSGRINQKTEIQIEQFPSVKTVSDLLTLLDEQSDLTSTPDTVLDAIERTLTGKAITNPICADMLVFQSDRDLQSITWSAQGFSKTSHQIWSKIAEDHTLNRSWMGYTAQISPDFKKLIIKTYCNCESIGGPLYLYDFGTQKLSNLNLALQLTMMSGEKDDTKTKMDMLSDWQLIGWHPNGHEVLIGIEAEPVAIWADLDKLEYHLIKLPNEGEEIRIGRKSADLLPDGSGFVYMSSVYDSMGITQLHLKLNLYDFATQTSRVLVDRSASNEWFYYPRFSPFGTKLAFVIQAVKPSRERSYSLQMLDMKGLKLTELVSSPYFGQMEPVWSPDETMLAFPWSIPDTVGYYEFSEADEWLGNVWVVSTETTKLQQVTHIRSSARRPVWSLDSKALSFFTYDGQFAMTTLANPEQPWQLAPAIDSYAKFGQVIFIP